MERNGRLVRYYVIPQGEGFRVEEATDLEIVERGLDRVFKGLPVVTREEAEEAIRIGSLE